MLLGIWILNTYIFFLCFQMSISKSRCSFLLLKDNHVRYHWKVIRTHFLALQAPLSVFVAFLLQNAHRDDILFSLHSSTFLFLQCAPTPHNYSRTHWGVFPISYKIWFHLSNVSQISALRAKPLLIAQRLPNLLMFSILTPLQTLPSLNVFKTSSPSLS